MAAEETKSGFDAEAAGHESGPSPIRTSAVEYGRGALGGLLIGMPLLFTMEMWTSGFTVPPSRLLLFFLFNLAVLLVLEYYSGFREEERLLDVGRDAVTAAGIGLVVSAVVLVLVDQVEAGMSVREIGGKIIIESIPISIGVSIAIGQLGQHEPEKERRKEQAGFWGNLAIATGGALVFGFNIAPTIEPMVLGLEVQWWQTLLLILVTIAIVHGIVFRLNFAGGHELPLERRWIGLLEESVTAYAMALLMAAYLLWTFGRLDAATGLLPGLQMTVALGLVTGLGAAVARLIL